MGYRADGLQRSRDIGSAGKYCGRAGKGHAAGWRSGGLPGALLGARMGVMAHPRGIASLRWGQLSVALRRASRCFGLLAYSSGLHLEVFAGT